MGNLRYKFKIFKSGFTLAEVLITLVIVGVIAALTIPTVVNNTKKHEYVSKLKKNYSVFAQVTSKIIAENGMPENWITTRENLYNLYKHNLSVAKDCGSNSGCFQQASEIKMLNGNSIGSNTYDTTGGMRFILSDGTQVRFGSFYPLCNDNDNGHSKDICAFIMVDLNGEKKPNTFGRDIFTFVITKEGFFPRGCYDGYSNLECGKYSSGSDCACKVLRENAMNY